MKKSRKIAEERLKRQNEKVERERLMKEEKLRKIQEARDLKVTSRDGKTSKEPVSSNGEQDSILQQYRKEIVADLKKVKADAIISVLKAVSYTHLTLPTIYSV